MKWISVKDRLPDFPTKMLLTYSIKDDSVSLTMHSEFLPRSADFWMELERPPKLETLYKVKATCIVGSGRMGDMRENVISEDYFKKKEKAVRFIKSFGDVKWVGMSAILEDKSMSFYLEEIEVAID